MKFHCFVTHFISVSSSSETIKEREGGGGGGSLQHQFRNCSKIMAVGDLKYSAPKITTSRHMQRNECSLKMNVFFYRKTEKAENLSRCFSDL